MNKTTLGFSDEKAESIIQILKSQSLPTLNGCLERQKTPNKDGYTNYKINNKIYGAHRLMYMLCVGLEDPNSVVMHSCDNRRCINIDHLKEGTHAKNQYECIARRRKEWQITPVDPNPIEPTVYKYAAKDVIEVFQRRLAGEDIDSIHASANVSVKKINEWLRSVFGTVNIALRTDLGVAEGVIVQGPRKEKEKQAKAREEKAPIVDIVKEARKAQKEQFAETVSVCMMQGMNLYDIARESGASLHKVRKHIIEEYGFEALPVKKKADKRMMAKDVWSGSNKEDVARQYGVSVGTVYVAMKTYPKEFFEKKILDATSSIEGPQIT